MELDFLLNFAKQIKTFNQFEQLKCLFVSHIILNEVNDEDEKEKIICSLYKFVPSKILKKYDIEELFDFECFLTEILEEDD